LVSLVVPN